MRHAGGTIEAGIDVACAGDLKAGEAFDGAERGDDLLRDDLGRFAQLARQFKGDGRGQFAELQVGRNLKRNGLELEIVLRLQYARRAARACSCNSRYTWEASEILDFQGRFYHLRHLRWDWTLAFRSLEVRWFSYHLRWRWTLAFRSLVGSVVFLPPAVGLGRRCSALDVRWFSYHMRWARHIAPSGSRRFGEFSHTTMRWASATYCASLAGSVVHHRWLDATIFARREASVGICLRQLTVGPDEVNWSRSLTSVESGRRWAHDSQPDLTNAAVALARSASTMP